MISQRLIRVVEQNAERLTQDLIAAIRRDPRTEAYHRMSDEDLHERALDLYRNLGQWLSGRTEFAVETRYQAFGRRRHKEGIPFSEVLFALTTAKGLLLDFIRGSVGAESAAELPLEYELAVAISQFYDKAIYHAAAGYEQAARAPAPAPAQAAAFPEPSEKVRKPLLREVALDRDELDMAVSRSGDIGESGG